MDTPTKTFTAKEMHNAPRKVYREADVNGSVKINNANYPDKMFVLTARKRGEIEEKEE